MLMYSILLQKLVVTGLIPVPLDDPRAGDEVSPGSHPPISLRFQSAIGGASVSQCDGGKTKEFARVGVVDGSHVQVHHVTQNHVENGCKMINVSEYKLDSFFICGVDECNVQGNHDIRITCRMTWRNSK